MEGAVERFGLDLALHGDLEGGEATVAFSLSGGAPSSGSDLTWHVHGEADLALHGEGRSGSTATRRTTTAVADWDEEMVVGMSFKEAHLERFALEMTASGDNDDGLSGKTGLTISIDGDELVDALLEGAASVDDLVSLSASLHNKNEEVFSMALGAEGDTDDRLYGKTRAADVRRRRGALRRPRGGECRLVLAPRGRLPAHDASVKSERGALPHEDDGARRGRGRPAGRDVAHGRHRRRGAAGRPRDGERSSPEGDDVALAFTVENQNKGLVSAQMTAHGESDDALLLGETTLEVTLAEEKAVDATAHASARWEDDWVLKLSLANDNAAIFAIDGTLDGKVELGSLSGDGAGTLVVTVGDEKALDLAFEGAVSTDPMQLSASLSNSGDNLMSLEASRSSWGQRSDGGGVDAAGSIDLSTGGHSLFTLAAPSARTISKRATASACSWTWTWTSAACSVARPCLRSWPWVWPSTTGARASRSPNQRRRWP